MKLSAYCYTNQGGREHNEDSVRCFAGEGRGIFVLADGLGGHGCGEVASALAADAICDGIAAGNPDAGELCAIFQAANAAIIDRQAVPGQEDMKTTAIALFVASDRAVWAHVGDSRLYRFSGDTLTQVTRDHSVSYMKYLGGEISRMDVYHDDDRPRLLRTLGREPCRPEAAECVPAEGDAFLLCSDGFWEYVYQEEILADLLKAETPEQWAKLMLLRHIRRTPPGNDNFSLITVFVEE
jgi:serine/threonine protein phosphatase PrpC